VAVTLSLADRVAETATNVGLSAFVLNGAVDNRHVTFETGAGNSVLVPYTAVHRISGQWEIGYGVTSVGGLTRVAVIANSAQTSAFINFSSGLVDVFLDQSGELLARLDDFAVQLDASGVDAAAAQRTIRAPRSTGAATPAPIIFQVGHVQPTGSTVQPWTTVLTLGDGTMVLAGAATISQTLGVTGLVTASGGATIASGSTLTLTGATVAGAPTWSSNQAITLSTASQPNVTTMANLTTIGTLVAGAVPASLVTAGAFGAGNYSFPSQLAINGRAIVGGTFTANSALSLQSNLTTTAGAAKGFDVVPAVTASANGDVIMMMRVLGSITPGTFTGVSFIGLQINGVNVSTWSSPADPISLQFGNINGGGLTANAYQIQFGATSGATNNYVMKHTNFNVLQSGLGVFAGVTVSSGSTLTLTGATVAGAPTWSSNQAITLSTAAQPNITSVGTLTSLTVSGAATLATGGAASSFGGTLVLGSNTFASAMFVTVNAAAGTTRDFSYQSAGLARWVMRTDGTAESGSDAGSNWSIIARHDDGTQIDAPIGIARAAGGTITFARLVSGAFNARFGPNMTVGNSGAAILPQVALRISSTITAVSGTGYGIISALTLVASANGDTLNGINFGSITYSTGVLTGVIAAGIVTPVINTSTWTSPGDPKGLVINPITATGVTANANNAYGILIGAITGAGNNYLIASTTPATFNISGLGAGTFGSTITAAGVITANAGATIATGQTLTLTGSTLAGAHTISGTAAFTNASPFSIANGQTLTLSTTAQTVGAATLTVPNFASVSDTFAFVTLAQTFSNKTLAAPIVTGTITLNSVAYTWPGTAGTNLFFLQTNGLGTLSWVSNPAAAAGSLTGTTLASNVVTSSLTSVGTLTALTVSGNITLSTNATFLRGTTTTPTTVNLISVPSGNTTRFLPAVDANGFEWTNQAGTLTFGSGLGVVAVGSSTTMQFGGALLTVGGGGTTAIGASVATYTTIVQAAGTQTGVVQGLNLGNSGGGLQLLVDSSTGTFSGTNYASVLAANNALILMANGGVTSVVGLVVKTTAIVQMPHYGVGTATFDASGNISSVSDERHKADIRPFRRGIEALRRVRPISYRYNGKSGMETEHFYSGFSAQNVRETIPEAVFQRADGILSFADRPVLAAVVNAVQDLDERVAKLERALKLAA
jgi:hypothetical protein